jgi:hypothetical protein
MSFKFVTYHPGFVEAGDEPDVEIHKLLDILDVPIVKRFHSMKKRLYFDLGYHIEKWPGVPLDYLTLLCVSKDNPQEKYVLGFVRRYDEEGNQIDL